MVRVFDNSPGDLGSIPGRVIPKTKKMVFDASLLNTRHYKVSVKWSNIGKRVAPSYRKGSLQVTLDYSRQLYFKKKKKNVNFWDGCYNFTIKLMLLICVRFNNIIEAEKNYQS